MHRAVLVSVFGILMPPALHCRPLLGMPFWAINETVPSGKGKRVQVWNAREQALFPPSPCNAFNLSDASVMSLQDLWLRTIDYS